LEATEKLNTMSKGQVCIARTPTTGLDWVAGRAKKWLPDSPAFAWIIMIDVAIGDLDGEGKLPMPDDRVEITSWKDTKSIHWTRLVLSSPLAGVSTAHNIGVLADQLVDSDDASTLVTLVTLGYTPHFQFTSPTQSLADKFRMIDRLIHGCPSLGIQPNSWLRNIVIGKNNWRKPPLDPL
jgi:hypothetical protein